VLDRLGSPYVTHRRPQLGTANGGDEEDGFGLGLGFFIAKTLLERSGAKLSLQNQMPPLHGATVAIVWNRAALERPSIQAPLEPIAAAS
jgi:two-component system sensor histidine kinase RegB